MRIKMINIIIVKLKSQSKKDILQSSYYFLNSERVREEEVSNIMHNT